MLEQNYLSGGEGPSGTRKISSVSPQFSLSHECAAKKKKLVCPRLQQKKRKKQTLLCRRLESVLMQPNASVQKL